MRALSVRQPYAELILRGVKTIEYRSRPTRIVGERFYIYAAGRRETKRRRDGETEGVEVWSRDLAMACGHDAPPAWMLAMMAELLGRDDLPTGVIVGTAVIERVTPPPPPLPPRTPPGRGVAMAGLYRWHLSGVERATTLRKPARHPQPTWFVPFAA